jgi:chromosome segregation ATPase
VLRFICRTTPPSMSDQIKFEVACDPSFAQALDNLGSRLDKTRSETIRDALNFYENAVNEWEKSKGYVKADEKSRLIDALEEAVKAVAKASKELDAAKQARKEAVEKERAACERLNALAEKRNQLELDLQNFFHRLHSTEPAQQEGQ